MASNDLFRSHGSGRLLPRVAQTTFQASDLLRASTNGGSCIPDSKLQKRRTRAENKTRPRLPQRSRYVSDNGLTTRGTLLDSSVLADSASTSIKGNTYAYMMNKAAADPEKGSIPSPESRFSGIGGCFVQESCMQYVFPLILVDAESASDTRDPD